MRTHILIGCGGLKLDHAAPARELYTGPLFRAARTHAEASGVPWAILSARYGLVMPADVIEPYDYRLQRVEGAPRSCYVTCRALGQQLRTWMRGRANVQIEAHAGTPYVRWVWDALREVYPNPVGVAAPLHGLQVGERLSWYRQRRAA